MQAWKDWFDEDAPEEAAIPDGYGTSLDTFRKLLLVRSWCPDRMIPMAKMYVAEALGKEVCCIIGGLIILTAIICNSSIIIPYL